MPCIIIPIASHFQGGENLPSMNRTNCENALIIQYLFVYLCQSLMSKKAGANRLLLN